MKGVDVPQADNLELVREVVKSITEGSHTAKALEESIKASPRHIQYALQAAQILGFLDRGQKPPLVTHSGRELLKTKVRSEEEGGVLRDAIKASRILAQLAPALLGPRPPLRERIARRIAALTGLSSVTARRRAGTLLSWRKALLNRQTDLFDALAGETGDQQSMGAADVTVPYHPSGLLLRTVEIERFGAIRKVRAELDAFMVFIGRNATGKSTFMDSLAFVSDSLAENVERAVLNRAQLLEELLWYGKDSSFCFAFEFHIPTELECDFPIVRYELEVGRLPDRSVGIRREGLFLRPAGSPPGHIVQADKTPRGWRKVLGLSENGIAFYRSERTEWKTVFSLGSRKLALSQLPEEAVRFPVANRLKALFRTGVQRLVLHAEAMKRPCSPLLGSAFRSDGSNLPLVVKQLQERDASRFQEWIDQLRIALPDLETVRCIEREEDRHLYLKLDYKSDLSLPAWRLSEGTLRLLALTLIPFSTERDAIYLIEEPENGVHPQAVAAVHEVLSQPFDTQILVATHSPVFVSIVNPDQLLCFSCENGETRIVAGKEHPALKDWQRDIDLGTLFASLVLT